MNNLKKRLPDYMSKERYDHTLSVRETAVELARLYSCDQGKAELASLLHDIARDMPFEDMKRMFNESRSGCADPELIASDPLLLHGYVGRIIAEKEFDVYDREILRSIELHTTGGRSMSLLDKIVFVADYIEPGRAFRGVKSARSLAYKNIDEAVLSILKSTLRSLLKRDRVIYPDAVLCYNELLLKHLEDRALPAKQRRGERF